jgi:Uncharacterized protein conserved in bacteria (DUF2184)
MPKGPIITSSFRKVRNAAGDLVPAPIRLNNEEKSHVAWCAREMESRFGKHPRLRYLNSLGYEVSITTLTTIMKKITEQKFFQIPPADYIPLRVGEGTWSSNLVTYRAFDVADEFETGIINTGGQNGRQASADAGIDALTIQVFNWTKAIGWSIFDLELAAKSGNWDLVSAKEKSRKRNWDLGIQRIAFLGADGQNASGGQCLGLLNQGGITTDTTTITQPISGMSPTDLKQFCQTVVEVYRNNNNRTAWPTHFIIPESDYNGLASQASAQFPIKSTLQLIEEMFQVIVRNKSFKILPLAYADGPYHANVSSIANQQIYTLLNYDEESLRMDIPLDYTNTLANSLNNFQFQNSGYGQFTGVLAYRPLELYYMTFPTSLAVI